MSTSRALVIDRGAPLHALAGALLVLSLIAIAFGIVQMPWLIAGAVLGVVVLAVALTAPFA